MPFGPDNKQWDLQELFIENLVHLIDEELALKWGIHFEDLTSEEINEKNKDFEKNDEIIILLEKDFGVLILEQDTRRILKDIYTNPEVGWKAVEFELIDERDKDDEDFEEQPQPIKNRQIAIKRGEIKPEPYEDPIPYIWAIKLKK